jgi:two-component system chemotaxis sensor kinase CheA
MRGLRVLLQLIGEGLHTVQQHRDGNAQHLVNALLMACVAGEQGALLGNAPNGTLAVDDAGQELLKLLGRDAREWASLVQPSMAPASDPATLSLNDAAALFMQIDVTDTADLTRLRDTLQGLANDRMAGTKESRQLLAEVAKKLNLLLQGNRRDLQSILTEAGWLLEGAIEARAGEEEAPQAKPLPQEALAPVKDDVPSVAFPSPGTAACVSESTASPAAAVVLLPAATDFELLGEFITEGREYISNAESALLALETRAEDHEAVNTVFRAFHTIKGTAAFLGLSVVADLAHHAESLLSRVRDRTIRCAGGYADLALRSVDMLKDLLQLLQDAMGGTQSALPGSYAELMLVLSDPEAAGVSEKEVATPLPPRLGDILVAQGKVSRDDVEDAAIVPPRLGDILIAQGKVSREDVEEAVTLQGQERLGVVLTRSGTASLSDVGQALRMQRQMLSGEVAMESSVRVRTDRLDLLIDMVGELVIAHSMVVQDNVVLHGGHHEFLKKITYAGKIVRELQDLSMSMRMVPLKATFQKMTRVVRDLSQKIGKQVNFVTEGEDTEIDRHIVDVLADPLVHMIRNAVDHGVEAPDVRAQVGKQRTGTVRLAAYHAGGNVVVELQDDGQGLHRDKILEKAIAKGLIESDKGMSDSDVFTLIFEPGFSTAEHVTDISGRGVGMDVVKRSLETIKGRIDIASEVGCGTTFSIYLPLTLAITDGMLVRVGQERFIIPTIDIYMSFQPAASALYTVSGRGELVMLRDELIPLFRLHRLFDIPNAGHEPTQGLLVVVNDGERHCALLVDELLGQQQVVAKSLGAGIGHIPGIFGAAILGDGRVGLILDPTGIVILARHSGGGGSQGLLAYSAA